MINDINYQNLKRNHLIVGGFRLIGSNITMRLSENKYNMTIISKTGKCDTLKNKNIKHFMNIGSIDEHFKNNGLQVEFMKEIPFSTYLFAKLVSTQMLQMLYRSKSFSITIIRLFITYGNNQKKDKLIPFVVDKFLKNLSFKLFKGKQFRVFSHISDILSGVLSIPGSKKTFGEIINLGLGHATSIRKIV